MFGIYDFVTLLGLGVLVVVVWQVISAFNRISKGIEEIAEILRQQFTPPRSD